MFRFCGSTGADLMEPLTCRGRRGTGATGTRLGYVDARLAPTWDWQKYEAWYRVWGRLTYDPDTSAEVCQRPFGTSEDARALASSLARASRILPVVTTAHLPSAACDAYWPEIYWNQPMVAVAQPNPYGDTPVPRTFQNVSPLDPQLFARISDVVEAWLSGAGSGQYTPIEVATWLEALAVDAEQNLSRAGAPASADARRLAIDIAMQVGLGRFFAAKLRAGVLYAVHERSGDRRALEEALAAYRRARNFWADVAGRARGVYQADLSASDRFSERGQWIDRLPGIDRDIEQMTARLTTATASSDPRVDAAIERALASPQRDPAPCTHQPPAGFRPGTAVPVALVATGGGDSSLAAWLHYRHVNQAERFERLDMQARDDRRLAAIPAAYTDSPYPLQYYFEVKAADGRAWIVPGFTSDRLNLPYIVLRRT